MSAGTPTNHKMTGYLQRNWFKLGIAIFLVFILFKKDLNFSVNLRSPAKQQQEETGAPTRRAKKEKNTELFTDVKAAKAESNSDKLDVSFFGSGSRTSKAIDALEKLDDAVVQSYLKRFARVAVSESEKFGIPASVILANAVLQSHAGKRDIAAAGNNHFALACTSDWQGATEDFDGNCYRKYDNAWTSFRDNSYYMTTGRLSNLKSLKNADYKKWAKALEKADYSNEADLADQLISIIEKYELTKLD